MTMRGRWLAACVAAGAVTVAAAPAVVRGGPTVSLERAAANAVTSARLAPASSAAEAPSAATCTGAKSEACGAPVNRPSRLRVAQRACPVEPGAALVRKIDPKTPATVARLADAILRLADGQEEGCVERLYLLFRAADLSAMTAYSTVQAPEMWPYPLHPLRRAQIAAELAKAGWRLSETDDTYLFEADPAWLADRFGARLPEAWRLYFQQKAREANEGYVEDDELMISWASLASRIGFWDGFLGRFPNFPEAPEVRQANDGYLKTLVFGLDNSPVHDGQEEPHVAPEVRQAYQGFIQEYPDSPRASVLREYLGYLKARDGEFDESTRSFLEARLR